MFAIPQCIDPKCKLQGNCSDGLTLLNPERPKLYAILAFMSAIGLKCPDILSTSLCNCILQVFKVSG